MGIKIDRFRVLNKQRGSATVLASFDVGFGPFTVRGYEIVRAGNNTFISVPNNAYKKSDGSGWDRFNFIVYDGTKGEQLEKQIQTMAMDELKRRSGAAVSAPADDDLLPF